MKLRPVANLALLLTLLAPVDAWSQCPKWIAGPFNDASGPNGANATVYAAISWDPDNAGPLPARLVVGGDFTSIGGVPALHIAQRDPASGQWSQIGSGLLPVYALTIFNGQLVAGGDGDNNVGTFDETVHRWDGATWQEFPATNTGNVTALEVYNGELYIGGSFMTHFTTSTNPAFYTARYNPSSNLWDVVGGNVFGTETNTNVSALAVHNGELYIGGWRHSNTLTSVADLGRWNGSSWVQITTGGDQGGIYDLRSYSGELVVGGGFLTLNGATRNNIAGWNGSSFHSFSTGTGGSPFGGAVYSIEVHQGLVIGGVFTTASGGSANHVAFMAPGGSTWQALGGGTDNTVQDLVSYGGQLIAVGSFTVAEQPANRIAHWDGVAWSPFGGGAGNYVLSMVSYNGRLVAGGDFHQPTTSLATAHNVGGWNGSNVSAFGAGTNGAVWALESFKYPTINGSYELLAGGSFSGAGGVAANNIARWNESPFTVFPPPAWAAMGAGFNNAVYAIERSGGFTYAGGAFTASGGTGLNRIARWNETSDVWEALGSGLNGFVYAIKEYNGALYVGGNFSTAGGVATGGLARWNGSSWSAVGGYFLDAVLSLEVHNGELIVGGQFSAVPGSPNIAVFNGTTFGSFPGGANNNVRAIKSLGSRLYIAGDFSNVGGIPVNRVAYWASNAWHDLPNGANNIVFALGSLNNELQAGGAFLDVDFGAASPIHSPFWGRFSDTGVPWFTGHPSSRSVAVGDDVSLSATVASGYTGLSYRWYHNNVPMNDGPTGFGSTIAGVHTTTLNIFDFAGADQGDYYMRVANSCGTANTFTANLSTTTLDAPEPAGGYPTLFESLGPNPARGPMQLNFSLAREADVQVRVFDIAGRQVRHLELGRLSGGRHHAAWDGCDPSGARMAPSSYILRLEANGRPVGTKRLIMMR